MKLSFMKFKGYTWPHNPRELKVSGVKNLKDFEIPFKGNLFQNFGREKTVVSGIGEFFGEDCIKQFDELYALFKEKNSGILNVPDMDPFLAEFKSLKMLVPPKPNLVEYSFEFWEDMTTEVAATNSFCDVHVVKSGETLWDIANAYKISVETLLRMNKNIKNPNDLSSCIVVVLA